MRRKLLLLDLALIALLVFVGFRFREIRRSARAREVRVLGARIAPEKYPPLPALHSPSPAVAADYADIAQKMLLARDRNPDVDCPAGAAAGEASNASASGGVWSYAVRRPEHYSQ